MKGLVIVGIVCFSLFMNNSQAAMAAGGTPAMEVDKSAEDVSKSAVRNLVDRMDRCVKALIKCDDVSVLQQAVSAIKAFSTTCINSLTQKKVVLSYVSFQPHYQKFITNLEALIETIEPPVYFPIDFEKSGQCRMHVYHVWSYANIITKYVYSLACLS